jgi:uncharacterized membrane protein YphA (DoxX/SURF4 family)
VTFWFGGDGLSGGAEEFRHDGFRGGRLTALAAGGGQIGSGACLIVGALTPWPLWLPVTTVVLDLASGLLTRLILHRSHG